MTDPGTAWLRLIAAAELGALLGLWYGFLRPLGPKRQVLRDSLFLLGVLGAWVWHSFAICRGDPRMGYFLGFLAGGFLWEMTVGRPLRRCFSCFWQKMGKLTGFFAAPLKKFFQKAKNMFASAEKWVTIRWNNRRHPPRRTGGGCHGRKEKNSRRCAGSLPPEQTPDQGGGDCRYRVVYRGAAGSAVDHE